MFFDIGETGQYIGAGWLDRVMTGANNALYSTFVATSALAVRVISTWKPNIKSKEK